MIVFRTRFLSVLQRGATSKERGPSPVSYTHLDVYKRQVYDNSILAKARTQYRNIIETLDGKIVAGNEHGYFVKGKVIVGAGTPDTIKGNVAEDDLVIISDREESQLICIEANCSCITVSYTHLDVYKRQDL